MQAVMQLSICKMYTRGSFAHVWTEATPGADNFSYITQSEMIDSLVKVMFSSLYSWYVHPRNATCLTPGEKG